VELALRKELRSPRVQRSLRFAASIILTGSLLLAPGVASAEGLFDLFFNGAPKQQRPQQPSPVSAFADPFGLNQQPASASASRPAASSGGRYTAYCVRTCDGKYFPLLTKGAPGPVQMCQAFCPASATRVYSGGSIDNAVSTNGERYADSENAFGFRKALRADCTCNGRDPAGLAPVDLSLDTSLRAGDVIATSDGLVAYSGIRVGANQTAEFTPVANYPGLTSEVRARLGEMKVAPVSAEMIPEATISAIDREALPPVTLVPKALSSRAKRAGID
jgi:Protein of unknown function (DUF2865)